MNSKLFPNIRVRGDRNVFIRIIAFGLLVMIVISCGNLGWESIDTDNEERLNIFGVISLDDSLQSFVVVHKTLDTAGPEDIVTGKDTVYFEVWEYYDDNIQQTVLDTFWYETPWIRTLYESRYLVKDATVIISDGSSDYLFERKLQENPHDRYSYGYSGVFSDEAVYLDLTGNFSPQPDTDYSLTINTTSGLSATGSLRTPPLPVIKESLLPDTVSVRNLFGIEWEYAGDFVTVVATDRVNDFSEYWVCGIEQWSSLELGDTTWISSFPSYCFEEGYEPDPDTRVLIDIRLRFLDENYSDYFLATGGAATISNILLGEGGIAAGYGIEGGFGVFGALSADWIRRIATP